jgi:choline-sulfatase
VSLIGSLDEAEKTADGETLLFGRPEAAGRLLSGWSDPERQRGRTFQWAVGKSASMVFRGTRNLPLYLHLNLRSFFPNPTEVLFNGHPVARFTVEDSDEPVGVAVPDAAVSGDRNVVELRFAETRKAPGDNDTRDLAAAAYYAILTPSKYLGTVTGNSDRFWEAGRATVAGKIYPALLLKAGGSLHYYMKLPAGARLTFGTFFHPSRIAESDDYAEFSILVRGDSMGERVAFARRVTDDEAAFHEVTLPSDSLDPVYDVVLKLVRNSAFSGDQTGWIEPTLSYTSPPEVPRKCVGRIRRANRQANVVVMVLDAAGARHFGCYGYTKKTTPVSDALAARSAVFDNAYCQAVYTLSSTASLMSGLYPFNHRVTVRKSRMPQEIYTLAEVFDNSGYHTGTFVSNGNASGIFGMTQGFQKIEEVFREKDYSGWAKDITNHFLAWLDTRPEPFFAYLHYREPHAPFNPPPGWVERFADPNYRGPADGSYETRTRINRGQMQATPADLAYVTSLYDANLAYGDYEVGRVLQRLHDLGIDDSTIVIVTADHGEAFWEHGFQGHNSQLYEESSHIPLIFHAPGLQPRRIEGTVRTIDIYPTLVDILGLAERGIRVDGSSFLPYLAGQAPDDREAIIHNLGEATFAYVEDGYKYIREIKSGHEELYDLRRDPEERDNLALKEPVRAGYCRSHLLVRTARARQQRVEKAILDEAARQNLKDLGYIDSD